MRPTAAVVALLLALACGDSTGPTEVDGTWNLVSLNDSTLPYDREGQGCCTYLSGRIVFGEGEYTASITARNRTSGTSFTVSETGTFSIQNGAIVFVRVDFVNQPIGLYAATVSGDTLTTAFGGEGPGSADEFEAVYVRG